MGIVEYSPHRMQEIVALYYRAVHDIDDRIYSQLEKNAWASHPIDYAFWKQRFAMKKPFLALVDGDVAGFIELEADGHIDCFYVCPKFQGQGVGSALYRFVERLALARDLACLYVEASHVAKPVFEHYGFCVLQRNCIVRQGVTLINFSMQKQLK